MSFDVTSGSPVGVATAPAPQPQSGSLRWALVRLATLWLPVAAVLSFSLWLAIDSTLPAWDWRDRVLPPFDALPAQLAFTLVVLVAGRFETAPRRGRISTASSRRAYWIAAVLVIALGVAALEFVSLNQPIPQ